MRTYLRYILMSFCVVNARYRSWNQSWLTVSKTHRSVLNNIHGPVRTTETLPFKLTTVGGSWGVITIVIHNAEVSGRFRYIPLELVSAYFHYLGAICKVKANVVGVVLLLLVRSHPVSRGSPP